MNKKIDIEHLVLSSILLLYPTQNVEQKMATYSGLYTDLQLTFAEVHYRGLYIEKELPGDNNFITDDRIKSWQTVQDIIDTVREVNV